MAMEIWGEITLITAILAIGAAFGGGLFDVVVNEENLARGFPDSVTHLRNYWRFRNPGDFYKLITPLFFLSALTTLVICWPDTSRRYYVVGAVGCYALTQLITVVYFFPLNRLLREGPIDAIERQVVTFTRARLWWDYARNLLTGAGFVLLLLALGRVSD